MVCRRNESINACIRLNETFIKKFNLKKKGIAAGSETHFQWVLAINLRVELMHLTNKSDCVFSDRPEDTGKECSDFFLIDEENVNFKKLQKIT